MAKTGKKVHFRGNFKVRNSKSTPPSQRNSKNTPFSLSVWCGKTKQKASTFGRFDRPLRLILFHVFLFDLYPVVELHQVYYETPISLNNCSTTSLASIRCNLLWCVWL